jgi:hypothetical protein
MAQYWSAGVNWSLGAAPVAGQDVVFKVDPTTGAGSAPCYLDVSTPTVGSLTFDPGWNQTLTFVGQPHVRGGGGGGGGGNTTLNAHKLTLNARTAASPTNYEIMTMGGTVHCDQAFELNGGSIGGGGTVQVEGTMNVGGQSATDKPTLGDVLNLGDGATATTMTYDDDTVPLVVQDSAEINVSSYATLSFDNCESPTAISNGDGGVHTITINPSGTMQTGGSTTVHVQVGIEDSGTVSIGGPFEVDGQNQEFKGWTKLAGDDVLSNTTTVKYGIQLSGGTLSLDGGKVLNCGTTGAPGDFNQQGGNFRLLGGTVNVAGNFLLSNGTFSTDGTTGGTVNLGTSGAFEMSGGALYVTNPTGAVGSLTINGNVSSVSGNVYVNCDSTAGTSGQLTVIGTLQLTNGNTATFYGHDLNRAAGGMSYYAIVTGGTTGDFGTYDLTGTAAWINTDTDLLVSS